MLHFAALISGLTYPIFGHWAWNGADEGLRTGWLGASGFVDFAGSSVVHSVGGWTSLATLLVLGPRAGRFPKAGPPRKIPGANTPVAALGVLLLWLGWFGFNGGSTLAMNNQVVPIIANTLMAGAAGLVAALALGWRIRGRADQVLAALDQTVARTRTIVGTARDGIITFSKHGLLITSLNPAVETIFGYPENELAGQPITLLFGPQRDAVQGLEPPDAGRTLPELIAVGAPRELIGRRRDGEPFPLEVVVAEAESGPEEFYVGTFRDITERKQMEHARVRLQEEIIHAQAATLAELSTPLIPISDQSLVMPLIGSVDSQRAQRVLEELLCGVEAHRARVVIIDITGVPLVDTQVANTLVRAAQAVRLLGAQVVLTGVRPEVAQTLVGLGVSLDSIITESTLQNGIAYALQRR